MRVLIAPDCFGDSLTAPEAVRAISSGWGRARPGDVLIPAPQSDGGPGFIDVLTGRSPGLRLHRSRVSGPLAGSGGGHVGTHPDADVDAAWILDQDTATAYIESARACGLTLLDGPPTPRTAVAAHSRGVGELIDAAVRQGARTVVVGLGGSCCTDGGRGMVDALGGLPAAIARTAGIHLVAATDVEHPLLGPTGAARVFGPQKGADPVTVEFLEQRMAAWADELEAATGRSVRTSAGAGAAGGLGAALLALGGIRQSGAAVIAAHTGLAVEIASTQLIVTGEGRLDGQSLHGKVVGTLAGLGRAAGVPVLVFAGQVTLTPAELRAAGIAEAHAVADHAGSVRRSIDDAAVQLSGLAEVTAGRLERE